MGIDTIQFRIETEREEDGRWLAEAIGLPGVLAYSKTADDAISRVQALGMRVWIAERRSSFFAQSPIQEELAMPKKPANDGKRWTPEQDQVLISYIKGNTPRGSSP